MKWTSEPPKEPGWYWLKIIIPKIVYIRKTTYGDWMVYQNGTYDVVKLSHPALENAQWAGPIPEPKE